jgi:hypothetical protein
VSGRNNLAVTRSPPSGRAATTKAATAATEAPTAKPTAAEASDPESAMPTTTAPSSPTEKHQAGTKKEKQGQ